MVHYAKVLLFLFSTVIDHRVGKTKSEQMCQDQIQIFIYFQAENVFTPVFHKDIIFISSGKWLMDCIQGHVRCLSSIRSNLQFSILSKSTSVLTGGVG